MIFDNGVVNIARDAGSIQTVLDPQLREISVQHATLPRKRVRPLSCIVDVQRCYEPEEGERTDEEDHDGDRPLNNWHTQHVHEKNLVR